MGVITIFGNTVAIYKDGERIGIAPPALVDINGFRQYQDKRIAVNQFLRTDVEISSTGSTSVTNAEPSLPPLRRG